MSPYIKPNPFSLTLHIADAAVLWQGLSDSQLSTVLIDDEGHAYSYAHPELGQRSRAILEAIYAKEIAGVATMAYRDENADYPDVIPIGEITLKKNVFLDWVKQREGLLKNVASISTALERKRAESAISPIAAPQDDELWSREKIAEYIGQTTKSVDRKRKDPCFPKPHSEDPLRWSAGDIKRYFSSSADRANTHTMDAPEADI